MEGKTDYRQEALALLKIGISVIPVSLDGSKLPKINWKEFQERHMTKEEVDQHFKSCGGVIAITGKISNLLCIDFDLDKQRETDNFWKDYTKEVPKHLKKKMLINGTRSGGYHVWIRTEYEDKSRKIARRPLTVPELVVRYNKMIECGANEETASSMLLKKPVECVIETRSRGSYGVFVHEQYLRYFGKKIQWFSNDEVEQLLGIAYGLDYTYKKPSTYRGKVENFKLIEKFKEDVDQQEISDMIVSTGLFQFHDIDTNGNYRLSRVGSSSPFSAYVYKSGVTQIFGLNPLTDEDKTSISPFEIFCIANEVDEQGAVELLKVRYSK